jgi:DNA-binding transcriptional MerR regulator
MPQDYSAADARRIVGITQRRLDYWDEQGYVSPSGDRETGKGSARRGPGRRYTYQDLLKLAIVKRLSDAGLSLQRIKKGLAKLRKKSAAGDPLLEEVLVTDGKTLLLRRSDDPAVLEDLLANGQLVFSVVAVGKIDEDLREDVVRFEKRISSRDRTSSPRRKAR